MRMIEKVMARKRQLLVSRQKWKWALANFTGAIFLLLESTAPSFHLFAQPENPWRFWSSSVELATCILLAVNTLVDLYAHFFPFGISSENASEIALSPRQMKLLGVRDQDFGFKATPPAKPKDSSKQHPFGFDSPLNGSFISPIQNSTMFSGQFSSMDSSSWVYQGMSPKENNLEKNRDFKPNLSLDGTFTDEASLKHFLSDIEEKEKILDISSVFNVSSKISIEKLDKGRLIAHIISFQKMTRGTRGTPTRPVQEIIPIKVWLISQNRTRYCAMFPTNYPRRCHFHQTHRNLETRLVEDLVGQPLV